MHGATVNFEADGSRSKARTLSIAPPLSLSHAKVQAPQRVS